MEDARQKAQAEARRIVQEAKAKVEREHYFKVQEIIKRLEAGSLTDRNPNRRSLVEMLAAMVLVFSDPMNDIIGKLILERDRAYAQGKADGYRQAVEAFARGVGIGN